MKFILVVLTTLFFHSIVAQDVYYLNDNKEEVPKEEATKVYTVLMKDELQYISTLSTIEGVILFEIRGQDINNDLVTGEKDFYVDGILSATISFVDNIRDGEMVRYHPNGEDVLSKGIHKNGNAFEGVFFYDNIHFLTEKYAYQKQIFKDGVQVGEVLLDKDYNTLVESEYVDGRIYSGTELSHNLETIYHQGKIVTETKYHDDSSQMKYKIVFTEAGSERYWYNEQGMELGSCIYRDALPYDGLNINSNSFYTTLTPYKNGKKDGEETLYDDQNTIIMQTFYTQDVITKTISTSIEDNSKLICNYQDGQPHNGTQLENLTIVTYKDGEEARKAIYHKEQNEGFPIYHILKIEDYDNSFWPTKVTIMFQGKSYSMEYEDLTPTNGYGMVNNVFVHVVNSMKTGEYKRFDEDGYILEKGNYDNDLIEGIVTYFPKDEKPVTCIFKTGEPYDGTVIQYSKRTEYKEGLKNGIQEFRRDNFSLKYTYVNDKKQGISTFVNDTISISGEYKDDKPFHGKLFNRNNRHIEEYIDGGKHGLFEGDLYDRIKEYSAYDHGKCLWHKTFIAGEYKGYIDGENVFTKDSIPSSITYIDGKPYEGTLLSLKNDTITLTPYKNSKVHGKTFVSIVSNYSDEPQQLIQTNLYVDGKKEGKSTFKITNEDDNSEWISCEYKNDLPWDGDEISRKGMVTFHSHYYQGLKQGEETCYYQNEKYNKSTLLFKNGQPQDGETKESVIYEDRNLEIIHTYVNGIKTESRFRIFQISTTWIEHQENGFSLETGDQLTGIVFDNADRTEGEIIFKNYDIEIGRFSFSNGRLTEGSLTQKDEDGAIIFDQKLVQGKVVTQAYDVINSDVYSQSTTDATGVKFLSYLDLIKLQFNYSTETKDKQTTYFKGSTKLGDLYETDDQIDHGIMINFPRNGYTTYRITTWESGYITNEYNSVEYEDLQDTIDSIHSGQ